jgi:phosphatidylethanolamine/phosphatidyl-N-methylethanolamine N-methyltransferase
MTLKYSYTLIAPIYDFIVAKASAHVRKKSLTALYRDNIETVLLTGVGSGLDIPYLPQGPKYTGIDLTPAMLSKARKRAEARSDIDLQPGDAMALSFDDNQFDMVVMHLILAVVPNPLLALKEAERVVKPGGKIIILDKFLRQGERAVIKRAINLFLRHIATRTDVVFEEHLEQCKELSLLHDKPALAGGWFRFITLEKRA